MSELRRDIRGEVFDLTKYIQNFEGADPAGFVYTNSLVNSDRVFMHRLMNL